MTHQDVVERIKAELEARHVSLVGPCGAFQIVKRVAWELKGEGAGLLSKPGGNNCEGYATDIICYPDGRVFDILISGGGEEDENKQPIPGTGNGPCWNPAGNGHLNPDERDRYRPAIDPGDDVGPVKDPTNPPHPPTGPDAIVDFVTLDAYVKARVLEAFEKLDDQHAETQRQLDVIDGRLDGVAERLTALELAIVELARHQAAPVVTGASSTGGCVFAPLAAQLKAGEERRRTTRRKKS